jgi:serine/threonine protein kinase
VLNRQPASRTTPLVTHVGDYRLLTLIGEGGMGVVHLAQAPDGRRVALKVLRPHIVGDDEARQRLAREVSSLRRVASPRVAEVLDADPWGETPYVATRYVPGLSLHEHLRQEGPITGADLAHFATGLAEAVIAVHQVGVLHRDIKPSNVLLEGRSPVLIDFGLARLAEDPRLTQTGWLLGTPGYLAPEILYGDDATTASDVHSWAATVVFACTGRPPFGTGPAMAIMDRVRRGEHDLTGVPPALAPLVRACLAPDPADRPGTWDLLDALRRTAPADVRSPGGEPVRPELPTIPVALTASAPATRAFTVVEPVAAPPVLRPAPPPVIRPAAPPVGASVLRPSRAPYMQPAPPQRREEPWQQPAAPVRAAPAGAGLLSRVLLLALLGVGALAFARAPYLTVLGAGGLTLAVRTVSWVTESALDRRVRRGRRRWYDGSLTLLSSPWYLLVAAAGTALLLGWALGVAALVGLVYLLLAGPLVPGMLATGAVFVLSLWSGPGSRRLRAPTGRALRSAARAPWAGWATCAVLGVVALLLAQGLGDVAWDPSPGAPWRDGTSLGTLLGWLGG